MTGGRRKTKKLKGYYNLLTGSIELNLDQLPANTFEGEKVGWDDSTRTVIIER